MNRLTPMQRLLVAMANVSFPLPVPRVRKEDLVVPRLPKDPLVLVDLPNPMPKQPWPWERTREFERYLTPLQDHPKDDELLALALDEGARQADRVTLGLGRPKRFGHGGKFLNMGKSEAQHKKLKSKRKAERLARRKNRR